MLTYLALRGPSGTAPCSCARVPVPVLPSMPSGVSPHILKTFDEDLATLRAMVLRMGGMVEQQLQQAVQALQCDDAAMAAGVVATDHEVDRCELRADEETALLLARRAPLGIDLRTVLAYAKSVNDLERVGDEAKKIARVAIDLAGHGDAEAPLALLADLQGVATLALGMLQGSLDAMARLDLARADAVCAADDALDAAYRRALAVLKQRMAAEPGDIDRAVMVLFALKALERIGDHARNVAQYVFYLVQGRDVRHPVGRVGDGKQAANGTA